MPRRPSKETQVVLDLIAKAQAGDLPSIVTRGRIDENGGQVFKKDGTQEIGVVENGKWRRLSTIERAILKRINELRNGATTQGGGGGGPIEPK